MLSKRLNRFRNKKLKLNQRLSRRLPRLIPMSKEVEIEAVGNVAEVREEDVGNTEAEEREELTVAVIEEPSEVEKEEKEVPTEVVEEVASTRDQTVSMLMASPLSRTTTLRTTDNNVAEVEVDTSVGIEEAREEVIEVVISEVEEREVPEVKGVLEVVIEVAKSRPLNNKRVPLNERCDG